MGRVLRPFLVLSLALCPVPALRAQEPAAVEGAQPLTVATKEAAPFVLRDGERWTGLSIELWELVAERLELEWDYVEHDLAGLLDAVAGGEADVGVAALTVTSEREERMDFGHTILTSGLSIAVAASNRSAFVALLGNVFSSDFVRAVGTLALVLVIFGALVWLFERRRNPDEFGGTALRGLGEGFWWSAVTMTTVGYGDRSPRSVGGRVVALVWMFTSIVIISGFTATIASSLTVSSLESSIRGPDDLPGVRVGSIENSTSSTWLDERRLSFTPYASVEEAMAALADGDLEAVVYDGPSLSWLASGRYGGRIRVLPQRLERQDYAIALPTGSHLREPLNRALLEVLATPDWEDVRQRYLGE